MAKTELMKIKVAQMTELFKENRGEFAWSLVDMPGLDPNMDIHKLNLDPNAKIIEQKKRMLIPKRQKAIVKEVERLKATRFIRKV